MKEKLILFLFLSSVATFLAVIVLNLSLINPDLLREKTHPTSDLYQKKYVEEIKKQSGNFDSTAKIAYFEGEKAHAPSFDVALSYLKDEQSQVLSATSTDRWIEVVLSQQRLIAHEGDSIFMNTLISSGKYGRTRKGDFKVWTKLRSTKMSGGVGRNYYYLPNVPCVMYFDGAIGLHGTYWHNNFGHPMSHGCVNMKTPDACQLFDWVSVGTRVLVH